MLESNYIPDNMDGLDGSTDDDALSNMFHTLKEDSTNGPNEPDLKVGPNRFRKHRG